MTKPPFEFSYEELESKSCEELFVLLAELPQGTSAKTLTAFSRKLYEVALIDNHVDERHRTSAWNLAQTIHSTLVQEASGNIQTVELLKQARQHHISTARLHGVGTLSWKLKEQRVSGAETVSFVMEPRNRALTKVLFETLPTESLKELRSHFVAELVLQNDSGVNDEVLILYGLTLRDDPALRALLTVEEYECLEAVPDDYARAKIMLIEAKLLLSPSSSKEFQEVKR